jgi:hypothetical protein
VLRDLRLAADRRDISARHDDLAKLRRVVRDYRPFVGGAAYGGA